MQLLRLVNFGSRKADLNTVGYALYNTDGTQKQARTTTGISEIIVGAVHTGIYRCLIDFDDDWQGYILWDTGEANPVYAAESYNYQDNLLEQIDLYVKTRRAGMLNITVSQSYIEIVSLADSQPTDVYTYIIYKGSNGEEFDSGNLTYLTGIQWKFSFTPVTQNEIYIVEVKDVSNNIVFSQSYKALGTVWDPATGMTGNELTTLTALKEYLDKKSDDTTDDDFLLNIIARVSKMIAKKCNRTFGVATITEYYKGNGKSEMFLRRPPINSITSIHIDSDRVWGSDTEIDLDDIIISDELTGKIIFDGDAFDESDDIENIKVVYNGGYSQIPEELERNCLRICMCDYAESRRLNNKVEGEKSLKEIRDEAWKEILSAYKLTQI